MKRGVFMKGIYEFTVNRIYQLCKERAITVKSILNGESKNPGIVTIKKICDGLDITLIDFFNTEEYFLLEQEIK